MPTKTFVSSGFGSADQQIHSLRRSVHRPEILQSREAVHDHELRLYEMVDIDEILPEPEEMAHVKGIAGEG
jgi:hypothetical protein